MTKKYQTNEFDTSALAVPEQVSVAMNDIAADMREGLLALAVGAGLQVMGQLMDADVTAVCGPRGQHDPERAATRHGTERGSVTLGGRRVPVTRPRIRAVDGSGEVPVGAYELFTSTELLGRMAMERMLAGVSTRRYPVGLEPVGDQVEQDAKSTSRSAVSRKFVAMTEHALADLLGADLSGLDLVAIMIDGVHFADHLCVVALGIGIDGVKHPLALVEGSTENTTLVKALLVGLRDRGLDVTNPILAVLDGAKALAAAVKEVFDHPVIARGQIHKLRNVGDHLPEKMRGPVQRRMRHAYHAGSALDAEAQLVALAKELDKTHPGAAGSLREGMAETLTVLRRVSGAQTLLQQGRVLSLLPALPIPFSEKRLGGLLTVGEKYVLVSVGEMEVGGLVAGGVDEDGPGGERRVVDVCLIVGILHRGDQGLREFQGVGVRVPGGVGDRLAC